MGVTTLGPSVPAELRVCVYGSPHLFSGIHDGEYCLPFMSNDHHHESCCRARVMYPISQLIINNSYLHGHPYGMYDGEYFYPAYE